MKTPGERIKDERQAKGWSQQRLADEISRIKKETISRAAVAQWEAGTSKTQRPENFFAAAKALGLQLEWLLNESGEKYLSPSSYSSHDSGVSESLPNVGSGPTIKGEVPLISWVQAGEYQSTVDNYAPGCGAEMIPTTIPVKRHTYALTVKGDSMTNPNGWPSFPEGMIIIVEPEFDALPGDFVIVKNGAEEATFKQLVQDGSDWYLKPLNPRYPIKAMTGDLRVVGVVRGYGGLLR